MPLEDFEIVSCIGQSGSSSVHKIIHKKSRKTYVWRIISSAQLSEKNILRLEDQVKLRKCVKHPHLLRFYDVFKESPDKYYIINEYCENGSLEDLIRRALNDNMYFTEEFLCRILYQIAFTLKTIDCFVGRLLPKEIFFDDKFNVKLNNFEYDCDKVTDLKMYDLGYTILQACTRKFTGGDSLDSDFISVSRLYSNSLATTIVHMAKDAGDLKANVNNVLCHPTILLKSSEWSKEKCFQKLDSLDQDTKAENGKYGAIFQKKIEKLRSKEIALQKREQKLDEREHKLIIRERKIAMQERIVKEKMHRADLLLLKAEDSRSADSGDNTKTDSDRNIPQNLDSTYVSCGDSVIVPTSKKLDVKEIVKPFSFTRTLSERRIRFKGHSPLKDLDFNKKKVTKPPKAYRESVDSSEWLTCSDDYEKLAGSAEGIGKSKKGKNLFQKLKQCSVEATAVADVNCKTNVWTEENKKYAFELLRLMNEKENMSDNVKHTYL